MKIENNAPRAPRCWIVLDVESAVLDDTAHKRYQAMERWVPSDDKPIRRGYERSEDPLTCPRWVFQTVTTAAVMVLTEDQQGGMNVVRFTTLSAPDHDEREVLAGILKVLEEAPAEAKLVTWAGLAHDAPLIVAGCMRHGLTLPKSWKWLAFGGFHRDRPIDLARKSDGRYENEADSPGRSDGRDEYTGKADRTAVRGDAPDLCRALGRGAGSL